ncbi:hypothetical protein N8608_01885 [bacterium]|nr:hypothetical protein [bacterium]
MSSSLLHWSLADVSYEHSPHKTPATVFRPFGSCFGLNAGKTQCLNYLRPHSAGWWARTSLTSLGTTMR